MGKKLKQETDSNIWNLKQINSPPLVTFDYSLAEYNKSFSQTNFNLLFYDQLEQMLSLLTTNNSELFLQEKSILNKIIYKNWNPLRKEKTLKLMRLLKRLINSFVDLKLESLLSNIKEISEMRDYSRNTTLKLIKTLPSREIFEFLLVRLNSAFKILDYSLNLIRTKILVSLIKSIKNGIYLSNNILFMSCLSRLYCFLRKYKSTTTFVYNSLRDFIHLFKSTSIKWSLEFNLNDLPDKLDTSSTQDQTLNHIDNLQIQLSEQVKINNKTLNDDLGEKIDREQFIQTTFNSNQRDFKSEQLNKKICKKFVKFACICYKKKTNSFKFKIFRKKIDRFLKKFLKIESNLNQNVLISETDWMKFRQCFTKSINLKCKFFKNNRNDTQKIVNLVFNLLNKNSK
jgi:hypothetical protein